MSKELAALQKLEELIKGNKDAFPNCPQAWNDIQQALKAVEDARQTDINTFPFGNYIRTDGYYGGGTAATTNNNTLGGCTVSYTGGYASSYPMTYYINTTYTTT